jgi:endogenous inhibitor of DNA gyrase (YacG/DUF329 family)
MAKRKNSGIYIGKATLLTGHCPICNVQSVIIDGVFTCCGHFMGTSTNQKIDVFELHDNIEKGDRIECAYCGKTFIKNRTWHRFCSNGCKMKSWNSNHILVKVKEDEKNDR